MNCANDFNPMARDGTAPMKLPPRENGQWRSALQWCPKAHFIGARSDKDIASFPWARLGNNRRIGI